MKFLSGKSVVFALAFAVGSLAGSVSMLTADATSAQLPYQCAYYIQGTTNCELCGGMECQPDGLCC